jgi:hypothetical protein
MKLAQIKQTRHFTKSLFFHMRLPEDRSWGTQQYIT